MASTPRPSAFALFVGDIFAFTLALWLALFFRSFSFPTEAILIAHLAAFLPLFAVWALIFFIAGLYESNQIILARRSLSARLLYAQACNVALAALMFFFVPLFGISPKTVLLIYLGISFLLVLLWRAYVFPWLGIRKTATAIMVGEGKDIEDLAQALKAARLSPLAVVDIVRPSQARAEVSSSLALHRPEFIVADFENPAVVDALPDLYNLLSKGTRFIDARSLYEEVFRRVPLSSLDERWIARNISRTLSAFYDPLKRLMDILIALPAFLVSLIVYPFISLAVWLEDRGAPLIAMERVGEGGKPLRIYKFRSMSGNDEGKYGEKGASALHVTRVGKFLRVSRLDELPQLWNVLRGDLSLIGPRPEFPQLVAVYEKEIPYYGVRHLIKPGLSGWAQLYHDNHPHHGTEVEATREKLSFDLYYLKHRSLMLDIIVAMKTIAKMFMRSGA